MKTGCSSGINATRNSRFAGFIASFRGRVEKTNKSELRNPLTYRVLIYIFEVGMKTFFLNWEISRSKSQLKKKIKINGLIFIFWGWRQLVGNTSLGYQKNMFAVPKHLVVIWVFLGQKCEQKNRAGPLPKFKTSQLPIPKPHSFL